MNRIFCDSSTTENCFVIEGGEPRVTKYSKPVTVNVGEYLAVIAALEWADSRRLRGVLVLTDSQLIVNQLTGVYKVKQEHLLPLNKQAKELAQRLGAKFKWIPREDNPAGKVLEP